MKTVSAIALGAALALGGLSVAAPAATQKQEAQQPQQRKFNISKEARPAIVALQEAVTANDTANFQARLSAAQAVAKSADDRYFIGQLQLKHALAVKDDNLTANALEALVASGGASQEELLGYYDHLGVLHFNAKRYAQAEAALRKLVEMQPNNSKAITNLGAALSAQNKSAEAVALFERSMTAAKAANQPVPESVYKQVLKMAYDSRQPKSIALARDLVSAYPTPDNWRNAIMIYQDVGNPPAEVNLDLLRLMRATKTMASEKNYYELAEAANSKGLPGEAKAVLDEGIAARVVSPTKPGFKDLIANVSGKVAEDRASLPSLEKKAMASSSGTLALSTGDAYYGYGDYAKAAALYKAAVQKGSVDANTANTRLGMALAMAGQKAEAEAALKAVTGPRADLAAYWMLWLNQRG